MNHEFCVVLAHTIGLMVGAYFGYRIGFIRGFKERALDILKINANYNKDVTENLKQKKIFEL